MRPTTFDVSAPLNTVGRLANVQEVRCRQAEYQHDLLTVIVSGYPKNSLDLRTGDPLEANVSFAGRGFGFVGHVQSVQPLDSYNTNDRSIMVRALGPSYRLKNEKARAWTRTSVSSVAAQVARENRLVADIESHPHLFDAITQPGISDWSLLVKMAKMVGYVVYVAGTTLVFRSRSNHLTDRQQAASSLVFTGQNHHLEQRSGIYTFEPTLSEAMPYADGMKGQRQIYGVDPRTGSIVTDHLSGASATATRSENNAGIFSIQDTGSTVLSPAEARVRNAGSDERARLTHRAHVTCQGVPGLRQSDEIYLGGLPNHYSGYWTTLEVTHRFTKLTYGIDMQVGTDSLGARRTNTVPEEKSGRPRFAASVLDVATRSWVPSNRGVRTTLESPKGVRKSRV